MRGEKRIGEIRIERREKNREERREQRGEIRIERREENREERREQRGENRIEGRDQNREPYGGLKSQREYKKEGSQWDERRERQEIKQRLVIKKECGGYRRFMHQYI